MKFKEALAHVFEVAIGITGATLVITLIVSLTAMIAKMGLVVWYGTNC